MLGKRQVAAPLIAQRAAHGALRPAHRRFQPGERVGVQLAGLRLSGKPQRPSQRQFGHETLVLGFALIAPAASHPGQHCAVRRQRGRQVAPCGHASTVGQRFLRLVLRDDQEERRRTSSPALAGRTPCPYGSGARSGGYVLAFCPGPVTRRLGRLGSLRLARPAQDQARPRATLRRDRDPGRVHADVHLSVRRRAGRLPPPLPAIYPPRHARHGRLARHHVRRDRPGHRPLPGRAQRKSISPGTRLGWRYRAAPATYAATM